MKAFKIAHPTILGGIKENILIDEIMETDGELSHDLGFSNEVMEYFIFAKQTLEEIRK